MLIQHPQGLEVTGLGERPGVDWPQAEFGHQAGHHLFGIGVVATQEHAQRLMAVARI
jgi:hypothetical protein